MPSTLRYRSLIKASLSFGTKSVIGHVAPAIDLPTPHLISFNKPSTYQERAEQTNLSRNRLSACAPAYEVCISIYWNTFKYYALFSIACHLYTCACRLLANKIAAMNNFNYYFNAFHSVKTGINSIFTLHSETFDTSSTAFI